MSWPVIHHSLAHLRIGAAAALNSGQALGLMHIYSTSESAPANLTPAALSPSFLSLFSSLPGSGN
eukprot:2926546-Heterocapsa_arctica.AAC.1